MSAPDIVANSNNGSSSEHFKVVLLGEGAVGKTSLMVRFVHGQFNEGPHRSTLQAAFATRRLNVRGRRVQLAVWDTAGQERFHALGPIYYRDAHGALLVYDVTDADSFRHVQRWVRQLRGQIGQRVQLMIVGNKVDLLPQREPASSSGVAVPEADACVYAESVSAGYMTVSAKSGAGVDAAFGWLCQQMISAADAVRAGGDSGAPHTADGGIRVNRLVVESDSPRDTIEASSRNSCC